MKPEKSISVLIIMIGVFSFFFLFFGIDISLHHHFQQTAWLSGKSFFYDHLKYAGGPGEYLALFISQFFYLNWLGSLIISLMGSFITFFIYRTLKAGRGDSHFVLFFLPLIQILILALTCDYRYPFSVTLNLFFVSLFLYITSMVGNRVRFKVAVHTVVAGILIYYISGGMFFLIFMISSFFLLWKKPLKYAVFNSLIILLELFLIPVISYKVIFLQSLYSSFFKAAPEVAVMLRYERTPFFFMTLGTIPGILLLNIISGIKLPESDGKKINNRMRSRPVLKWIQKSKDALYFSTALLIPAFFAVFVLVKSFHVQEKIKIAVDYHAYHKEWDKVTEFSAKVKEYDRMVNFQFNRAMCATGQMLNKLFNYEQILGSQALFLDRPFAAEIALPNSDLYFDLGNIDESQRLAFESQTLMTVSPRVLKRLTTNCIIQENKKAAQTYLNVLAKNPVEKKWVRKFDTLLNNQEQFLNSEIEIKRNDLYKTEGILVTPRTKLLGLLNRNPQNKPAFEYLVAFDLMEHDLNAFLNDLELLPNYEYEKLPAIIEEAVLLFRSQRPNITSLQQYKLSPATVERFRKFASLTSANSGNREKAKQATHEFKDTYWYYVLFISPLVTNIKVETRPVEVNY